MYYSLTNGQSVTVLYGWILVSLISLAIAASLAEICAVFPTAGGVYYVSWASKYTSRHLLTTYKVVSHAFDEAMGAIGFIYYWNFDLDWKLDVGFVHVDQGDDQLTI